MSRKGIAEDLIKNAQVQAIIVRPQTSAEADLFAQLGSRNRILVLSFSDISPTLRLHTTPFFVHTSVEESLQVALIADILTSLSWHEAIFVCEDSPYGSGVHQALSDALQRNKIHTMDSVVVPIAVTDDQLDQILYRLKEKPARLFIVHMRPALTAHLFSKVKYAGMITEDYVWIAASIALDNLVESLSPDDSDYLQGVLTLQPVQVTRFKARYRNNPGPDDLHDPSLLFWAYEIARLSSSALWMAETEFGKNGVSASRRAPVHSIIDASFDALAGRYKLVNGERQLPSYEIVIATAKGAVGVRSWTQFYFLPQDLSTEGSSFLNSRSGSGTVKPVFWQEDSVMASERHENIGFTRELETKSSANPEAKRRKLDGQNLHKMCGVLPKVPLKIGLPRKDGFKEFLNVLPPYLSCHNSSSLPSTTEQITGCSMDFFKAAMTKIQLDHRCYEFCVFEGTYDALVRDVSLGNLDGAVGDLTITSERTKGADFTMPYTQSGVYLLVLGENDMESIQWIFVKPLTWKLWFATVVFFFFTGFVVWMIERPRNPAYQGSRLRQFITASYFSFSTLTFSHDKLRPSVKDLDQLLEDGDNVGYQTGSFVHSILRSKGWNDNRLSNYSTKEQYAEALRKGSKDGGVSAIVEEIPFLTSFLSDPQYQKEFKMIKTIYKTPGFGFVFSLGFPLLHNLSTVILNVTGGDEGSQIQAKWLGTVHHHRIMTGPT
ncbi:hypothetical protein PR202_gb17654 [Eleusine coracana subsp. coracana]|uniref:Ionotropic glutamate receptor C-terminal domain-containing protein n=1 Tax=Eleusine coracana subsp. coracana TaxID=191504 RepID=A0AAV5F171_ELECO|nr:hypothetical protein PR202_gb17654 [Eleusine coracana subsp. coracana]